MDIFKRIVVVSVVAVSAPFCMALSNFYASENLKAPVGTYQVIGNVHSLSEEHMDSLRRVIQSKRDKEKEIIITISAETKVRILPEKEIQDTHFQPVEEFVFEQSKVKRVNQ